MGMRNSRNRARMWLPARPPKMPYSCLQRDDVDVVDVQKVGRAVMGFDIFLDQFKADGGG